MFLLFFLLWIIFAAGISIEICVFGFIIAAAIFFFLCKCMDYSFKKEVFLYKKSGLFLRYLLLLVREIIKANLTTIKLILSQREEIEPALVTFESSLKTAVGKTLLADAITLTPGTITVSLDENTFQVHCLDKDLAQGLIDSEFEKLAQKLELEEEN